MPAAAAPTRDSSRSNTEAAGAREHPLSRVGAKKGEKNVKRVKKKYERELEELQNFIFPTKNIPEWNISQAVKLRLKGFSYREIEKR